MSSENTLQAALMRDRQLGLSWFFGTTGVVAISLAGCDNSLTPRTSHVTHELSRPAAESADPSPAETPPAGEPAADDTLHEITFDDLRLDMPLGTLFDRSMLTPQAAGLDGRRVRLGGFIYAGGVFQQSGIKSFPFVMNTQCKFGPQGLAYCVILVDLDKGVTTDFTTYPITVEGRLTVRPYDAGGFTWSVYHMQGQRVY